MMGGPGSLRDIKESRSMGADVFEFPLVESIFSLKKILNSLKKVFADDLQMLKNKLIFINICTFDGLESLENISNLQFLEFIYELNFVFNFDRKMIIFSKNSLKEDSFDVIEYEKYINQIIFGIIKKHNDVSTFKFSISGTIGNECLASFWANNLKPNFIKIGMFTLPIINKISLDVLKEQVLSFQAIEADLLEIIKKSFKFKNDYVFRRQENMINYNL